LDGGGGDVHSDCRDAPPGKRKQVTTRAAADVEHGPDGMFEYAVIGGGGRAKPAVEWQRSSIPVLVPDKQLATLEPKRVQVGGGRRSHGSAGVGALMPRRE
jgi:hypothetical protein